MSDLTNDALHFKFSAMVETVPENIDFVKEEEKILELWKSIDAFKTSLKLSKGKPR